MNWSFKASTIWVIFNDFCNGSKNQQEPPWVELLWQFARNPEFLCSMYFFKNRQKNCWNSVKRDQTKWALGFESCFDEIAFWKRALCNLTLKLFSFIPCLLIQRSSRFFLFQGQWAESWDFTYYRHITHWCLKQWLSLGKKATIHQLTTMLATSKNVQFPGHSHPANHLFWWPNTLIISTGG